MSQNNVEAISREQHKFQQSALLDLYACLIKQYRKHPRIFRMGLIVSTLFGSLSNLSLPDTVSAHELTQYINPLENKPLQVSTLPTNAINVIDRKDVVVQASELITDTLWTTGSYTATNIEMQLFTSQYPGLNAKRIWEVQKGKDEGRGLPQLSQLKQNTWVCGYAVAEPESLEYLHFLKSARTNVEIGVQQGTHKAEDLTNGTIENEAFTEWKKQVLLDLTSIYGKQTADKFVEVSCSPPIIFSSSVLTSTNVVTPTGTTEPERKKVSLLDTTYSLSVSKEGNFILSYELNGQMIYEEIPIPHSIYNTQLVRTDSTLVLTYLTNDDDGTIHSMEIIYYGKSAQGVSIWSSAKELETRTESNENPIVPIAIGGSVVATILLGLDSIRKANKQNYIATAGKPEEVVRHKGKTTVSTSQVPSKSPQPNSGKKSSQVDPREASIRKTVTDGYKKQARYPVDVSPIEKKIREKAWLEANIDNIETAVSRLLGK